MLPAACTIDAHKCSEACNGNGSTVDYAYAVLAAQDLITRFNWARNICAFVK